MIDKVSFIIDAFQACDISLKEEQAKQFFDYYELLVDRNRTMNLTSILSFEDVVYKHFVDSVFYFSNAMEYSNCSLDEEFSLLDVGTGAGFPGLPLKILYPNIKLTLLDSLDKRISFLREVCFSLSIEGVSLLHGRAEDYSRNPIYRDKFDVVVSRAVASLPVLTEYCLPFVSVDGLFLSLKGNHYESELDSSDDAIFLLNGALESVEEFVLPFSDIQRSLIVIRKEDLTPDRYPRKAGIPEKRPL